MSKQVEDHTVVVKFLIMIYEGVARRKSTMQNG